MGQVTKPLRKIGGAFASGRLGDWALAVVGLTLLAVKRLLRSGWRGDFETFYLASAAAHHGRNLYDVQSLRHLGEQLGIVGPIWPYLYPPPFAYLVPISRFSTGVAQRLWDGSTILLFALAMVLVTENCVGQVGSTTRQRRYYLFGTLLIAWVLAFVNNLAIGQVNLLVLSCIVVALHLDRQGSPWRAGFFLSLAIAVKMTPAMLLLFFAARGKWRVTTGCLLSIALLAAVSLVLGARVAWEQFFTVLPAMARGASIAGLFSVAVPWNFSLAGVLARALPGTPGYIRWLTLAGAALLALPPFWMARGGERAKEDAALLGLSIAMVLAAPFAYKHHVIYLVPGMVWWLSHALEAQRWTLAALAVSLCLVASSRPPLTGPLVSLNFVALLSIYLLVIVTVFAPEKSCHNTSATSPDHVLTRVWSLMTV